MGAAVQSRCTGDEVTAPLYQAGDAPAWRTRGALMIPNGSFFKCAQTAGVQVGAHEESGRPRATTTTIQRRTRSRISSRKFATNHLSSSSHTCLLTFLWIP